MPFTLAHPLVVLPFAKSRFVHFPALVIGAMSPDFIYFLAGKPTDGGHQFLHSEWLNLPLCVLVYTLYRLLIAPDLRRYLPNCLNAQFPLAHFSSPLKTALVFLLSAWFGMITHLFWDNFTHYSGYFVQLFPVLKSEWHGVRIYKWLQYIGGVVGLSGIAAFWLYWAHKAPRVSAKTAREKSGYWLAVFVLFCGGMGVWHGVAPIAWGEYSFWVIRAVNVFLLSLIALNGLKRLKRGG